ncbi:MAG TPA: right-handed parallel beta-helix repeat-containing protein [Phycisphaerae bacterium]|nr:right-handed parallel beta-helix repeat-containing protein [Phycisphaerae bacterium]
MVLSHKVALAVLLLSCLAPAAVSGKDYYVSPTGDDTRAGTSAEAAFRSLGKAAAGAAPGDVVHIAPGRYVENVVVPSSGTKEASITFRRDGWGEVALTSPQPDPAAWDDKFVFRVDGKSHIVVEGITFRDCAAWILLRDASHCVIRNCVFDGVRIYNAFRINSGSFNRIEGCDFKRAIQQTGFREQEPWIPVPGADYIEIFRDSHNNLVQGCRFGPITHTAVSVSAVEPKKFAPSHNIVRGNTFTDPQWKCLWFHAGPHNVFEDNVCSGASAGFVQLEAPRSIIRRNVFRNYRDSTKGNPHIDLRGVMRFQYEGTQGNRIYNNLFVDNERTLTNNSWSGTVTDNLFKNNIFCNNAQTIFLGWPDYESRNRNVFQNNLIRGTEAGLKVVQIQRDKSYTLADAQRLLPALFADNIEAMPLFVDAAKADYRPATTSPTIDAGAPLTVATAAGKGAVVPVEDPLYFCDGFGQIDGDMVAVGDNAPARLVKVDYEARTLTLDREVSWQDKAPVTLAFQGKAPDLGPFEARRE